MSSPANILACLEQRLQPREFDRLREEAGFSAPNDFPVERLVELLRTREFPPADWYEFQWAIYECQFEALGRCSVAMRAFLAFVYVYCNKRKQWGIVIESDYYHALVQAASSDPWLAGLSLSFIEWLSECVEADEGYNDYFASVSWLLLRRILGETSDSKFAGVIEKLAAEAYTPEQLRTLTVSDRGVASWLKLHCGTPGSLDAETDRKIVAILTGAAVVAPREFSE